MCRLLGYVGPRVSLDRVLYHPEHSLLVQSYAPRRQRHGTVNADGWGVGWYDLSVRPEPARYRTATPMWADARFPEMAPLVASELVVAGVRDATPGAPIEESGAPPFLADRFLFAHNGVIDGFRDGLGTELRRSLSPARERQLLGTADSEVVFALVLDRIDRGWAPADALVDVVRQLDGLTTGRFNFLLADGLELVATVAGDSLFVLEVPAAQEVPRATDGRSTAAPSFDRAEGGFTNEPPMARYLVSEPFDDDDRWQEVTDHSLVRASRDGLTITSL